MFATTKSSTLSPIFSPRRTSSAFSKPKLWKVPCSPGHLALDLTSTPRRRNLCVSCSSSSEEHGSSHRSSIQVPIYDFSSFICWLIYFIVTIIIVWCFDSEPKYLPCFRVVNNLSFTLHTTPKQKNVPKDNLIFIILAGWFFSWKNRDLCVTNQWIPYPSMMLIFNFFFVKMMLIFLKINFHTSQTN